jgi:hypothetical protein
MRNIRSEIVVLPSGGMAIRIPTFLGMFFFLFLSTPSSAAVIRVPADYSTIQAAINAATPGDEIIVSTGTYTENINFLGKNIVLRSTDPTSPAVVAATIIDGKNIYPITPFVMASVTFAGSELATCVLEGFTITGGYDVYGGGICGNGARVTIQHNFILGNKGADGGGGISDCDGLIQNNTISGNVTDIHGGGLWGCAGTIQNNIICNNMGFGALMRCDGVVQNNTIYGNFSWGDGSGFLYCHGVIRNCIIWGNIGGTQLLDTSVPSYSCIQDWTGGGTGNIVLNPQMTNPTSGDFHLLPISPCIDAGGAVTLTQDFEGDPRPYDYTSQPRGDGSDFDIGADECLAPCLAFAPESISHCAVVGTNAATQTLEIWNVGHQTLHYTIATTPSWLAAQPASGLSDGPASRTAHRLIFQTVSLPAGDYAGTITITASGAVNTTATIPVSVKSGSVTLLSPGGGETWFRGAEKQIQWVSHGPCNQVRIGLRRHRYPKTLATVSNQEGANSCTVRLPNDLWEANDYVLFVAWTCCLNVIRDESTSITIHRLVEKIAWPAGGTAWQTGTTGTVQWTCFNLPAPSQMDVELWQGDILARTLARVPCSNGQNSAGVLLPADMAMGSNYWLNLRWVEDNTVSFYSDSFRVIRALIQVPQNYGTIQAAIDAAQHGDLVQVARGNYVENIQFKGKNILLCAPDGATILGRDDPHFSVVTFAGSELTSCVLSGFTITNGWGGICGNGTRATIESNAVTANLAEYQGAGIYGCNGTIQNNVISGNSVVANWNREVFGGGLAGCHGIIQKNFITDNSAVGQYFGFGGGLADCGGIIQNNIIAGNSVGALWADRDTYSAGAGLYRCGGIIRNNTICGNWFTGAGSDYGGGLYNCGGTIRNCIVWGNSGDQLWGGAMPSYSCIQSWSGGGDGNIAGDPQYSNYRLVPTSPCIDAGGTVTLAEDIDGDPRPYNFISTPRGDGSDFDIGADEYVPPPPAIAFNPQTLIVWAPVGTNPATNTLQIWNSGGLTLDYTVATTPSWLTAIPAGGSSGGPTSRTAHQIGFRTASLPEGDYAGTITIVASGDVTSTATIPVCLIIGRAVTVVSPAANEAWYRGSVKQIQWQSLGGWDRVYVYLRRPGYYALLSTTANHKGLNSCLVQLAQDLPEAGDYVIGVAWTLWPTEVYDESTSLTIRPLVERIVSPTTGTIWKVGTTATVVWTCRNLAGPSQMDLELWRGGTKAAYLRRAPCQNGTNVAIVSVPAVLPHRTDYQLRLVWTEETSVAFRGESFHVAGRVYVPGDYSSIGAAINAAPESEEIVVSVGAYQENINFLGKNIILRSTNPTSPSVVGATIIDGRRAGSVVTFAGSELSSCVLAGFTIRNGSTRLGGGICGNGTHATIHHNLISSNSALGTSPNWGRGGGLYACNGTIESNRILANSSDYGGGLCDCQGTVQNNGIANNSARKDGGGLRECTGTIWNNTIVSNKATAGGGGLSNCPGTIRNCIVWSNTAATSPQLSNSSPPSYSCIQNWTGGGTGNLSADPLVAAPWRGDFHLLDNSPCIDAGGTVPLALDFEGDPRPFDLTAQARGDGSDFDIGADEAISPPTMFAITWPTSGTVWQAGTMGNLTFTRSYLPGPSQADVEVWKDGTSATSVGRVACQDGPNTVPVRLAATVPAGTNYRIRMFWTLNRVFNSWSQGFTVTTAPTLAVTLPTASTVWHGRTTGQVNWTCANFPEPLQMDLELWKSGQSLRLLKTLACPNGTNSTTVSVTTDLVTGSDYQVLLLWTGDRGIRSASPRFTILAAAPTTFTVGHGSGYHFQTIQGAINAAIHGDGIIVSPGAYRENINVLGKNICLRSTNSASPSVVAATIIDGNQTGSVVTFAGSEQSSCILSGFTITRGRADSGGGIRGNRSHATVQSNVISSNVATAGGAAHNLDGTLRWNQILDNTASYEGGALAYCDGLVENNLIARNSTTIYGTLHKCQATIRGNTIRDNHALTGGGIYGTDRTIENNLIYNNTASYDGGGLSRCAGTIRNNTIVGNQATNSGGGLERCAATIINCILYGNSAPSGPQLSASTTPTYSCIQGWSGGGTGNISTNPQLADPAHGDFHLLVSSPCVDAGGKVTLTSDFEGDPRPCNFVATARGDGSDFDIGADEVVPRFTITWPTTGTKWQAGTMGNLAFTCANLAAPSEAIVEVWRGSAMTASVGRVSCQNGANVAPVRLPGIVPSASDYQIRMFWSAYTAVNAWSNKFTVTAAPTFTITWPTTGTIWRAGSSRDVAFTCANLPALGQARVELWKNGKVLRYLTQVASKNGKNTATIGLPGDLALGLDYQIALFWTETTAVRGFSGKFTVTRVGQPTAVSRFRFYR